MSVKSVFIITPLKSKTSTWLKSNIDEEAVWVQNTLVVQHHYIEDIIQGLYFAGFTENTDYSIS